MKKIRTDEEIKEILAIRAVKYFAVYNDLKSHDELCWECFHAAKDKERCDYGISLAYAAKEHHQVLVSKI